VVRIGKTKNSRPGERKKEKRRVVHFRSAKDAVYER
jgi:hypothetical protein